MLASGCRMKRKIRKQGPPADEQHERLLKNITGLVRRTLEMIGSVGPLGTPQLPQGIWTTTPRRHVHCTVVTVHVDVSRLASQHVTRAWSRCNNLLVLQNVGEENHEENGEEDENPSSMLYCKEAACSIY